MLPPVDAESGRQRALDAALVDYQVQRAEAQFQSRVADTAAFTAITITVAVIGVAIKSAIFRNVALLLPVANIAFLYGYLHHTATLIRVRNYAENTVAVKARALTHDRDLLQWHSHRGGALALGGLTRFPYAFFVFLADAVALIAGTTSGGYSLACLIIGGVVTALSCALWFVYHHGFTPA